jgi:hypothetical protein
MRIDDRHMLVGPISYVMMLYFAAIFILLAKMNYQKKFEWKFLPIYPFAYFFLFLDFIYNVTVGTFLFLELPREILFTARLERHKKSDNKDYREFAWYACGLLERYDPGHCR